MEGRGRSLRHKQDPPDGGRTSVEAAAEVSSLERDIARMAMVLDERLSRIEEALMISPESSASRLWTGSIKE